MAGLHLVTGYKGSAHITSADQGAFNAMCVGTENYVLTKGRRFEAELLGNNTVRIYDGCLLMNGRYVSLDNYLDATIANGSQGMNRHDFITIRYSKDTTTGIESVNLEVIPGKAISGTPIDPVPYVDSILDGANLHDMPLYRVIIEGLSISKVEPLFQVLAPMSEFQHGFYKQNMLINGDFQCNQRGKTSYDSGDVAYTLDMWRAYAVKVDVLTEGVKLTGKVSNGVGYFTQFIQLGVLKTTTYTISTMVDDKTYSFSVTPGASAKEKNFGKFKISALTTSTWDNDLNGYNNKLKINLLVNGTNSITVKYIDVFEGSVAYPHVKEDPATALMRCRRYVQKGTYFSPILEIVAHSSGTPQLRFGIPIENMAKEPILEDCEWYAKNVSGNKNGLETHYKTGREWQFDTTTLRNEGVETSVHGVRVRYTLSCEHKPDGD